MRSERARRMLAGRMFFSLLIMIAARSVAAAAAVPASGASNETCSDFGVKCLSGAGLIADSTLGLTEVVWVGPESKKIYVGSPSIWKLHDGALVTSHDFFGASTVGDTVQVLIDESGQGDGAKWAHAGNVSGMYWANIFTHPARASEVYLLGVSSGDSARIRHIVISKSTDRGKTWSTPSILFESSLNARVYHCAPTPTLLASDGRLHRAFETDGDRTALLISTVTAGTLKLIVAY